MASILTKQTSLDLDAARSENQLLTHTNDLYELVIALRQEAVGVLEALTEVMPGRVTV